MKKYCVAIAIIAILSPGTAFAGRLELGNAQVDGDLVTIPINLTGDVGEGVAAMDFQMRYDPQVLEPVEAGVGPAASQAGKQVSQNSSDPGSYTLVIMGLNQGVMQQGEVASVVMRRVGDAAGGTSNIRIVETTFASLAAEEIPSRGDSQNLRLDGSDSTDPEDKPEEDTQEDEDMDGDDPVEASDSATSDRSTQAAANNASTPGTTGTSPQQMAASGQNATGGGVGGAPAGQTDAGETASGSNAATNRTNLGERMSTAVSEASGTRTSLPAPQASAAGQTPATKASPAGQVTSTTPTPSAPDDSNAQLIHVAQAESPETSMPSSAGATANASQTGSSGDEATTSGSATDVASAESPAAAAGGRDIKLVGIVGGAVVLGIGALLFVRKKLFA